MLIVYRSPVDGMDRARAISNYREAGMVMAALAEMGCDPTFVQNATDLVNAKTTALPLIVHPWSPSDLSIIRSRAYDTD